MRMLVLTLIVAGCVTAPATALAQTPSGEAVYKTRCAACHDNAADARTPSRATLQNMTPSRILRTLDFGAMMTIAYTLRRDEREAVASFLGKPGPEPRPRPEAYCSDRSVALKDVAFYLSVMTFGLFLAHQSVESQRWRA